MPNEQLPRRRWTIHLLHHSHTDIGFTELQNRITRYQIDYIRQALAIVERAQAENDAELQQFRWNCETFWVVERFLEIASEDEKARFADAARKGRIGLSASYLHFTELVPWEILNRVLGKGMAYARSIGATMDTALQCDVNGFGWGYCRALIENGIGNLFTCINAYHGIFPLRRLQTPFWWEGPQGGRVLVWSGPIYVFGNDLCLSPGAEYSYMIRDEFQTRRSMENRAVVADARVSRYLRQLEQDDYPYDFVPVMIHGLSMDNAPPSAEIARVVAEWNACHDAIKLRMSTLSEFFATLRAAPGEIPAHKGDWPDWWSEGMASTAVGVQFYRQAVRDLRYLRRLNETQNSDQSAAADQCEYDLTMFGEHTWGHSDSIKSPWAPRVKALEQNHQLYALEAYSKVNEAIDAVHSALGWTAPRWDKAYRFKIINPMPWRVSGTAHLHVEEDEPKTPGENATAWCEREGRSYPVVFGKDLRELTYSLFVNLAPGEEKEIELRPAEAKKIETRSMFELRGYDGVLDVRPNRKLGTEGSETSVGEQYLETPHVRIEWHEGEGITCWLDKASGVDLLRSDRPHGAFTPIYERTPAEQRSQAQWDERLKIGRNRKGRNVKREAGRLTGSGAGEANELFASVELEYEVAGCTFYRVVLRALKDLPRVDVSVRLLKHAVWDAESLYIALPFTSGAGEETLWLEKAGAIVQPRVDQLPGTLVDFYCIQEGFALVGGGRGVALALRDTPVLQMGPLSHGTRLLMGDPELKDDPGHLYAWALTNYWETNFAANLGGFYEFRYHIQWAPDLADPPRAIEACRVMNDEIRVIRVG